MQKTIDELLVLLGTKARASVSKNKKDKILAINIDAKEETGLLIGRRGETLNSLQLVLGLIARGKGDTEERLVVNVGDYREKQEDYLIRLAQETAQRALDTQEAQSLYNLTPAERRIVHIALSENDKVTTESVGEGEGRYLIVKPKKK